MAAFGSIKSVLSDERIMALQDVLDRYDAEAIGAQTAFKNFSMVFIFATAFAALAAALILFGSGVEDSVDAHPAAAFVKRDAVQNLLFVIQIVSLAAAAFAAHVQENREHVNRWESKRRLAEETRMELFETIFAVTENASQGDRKLAFEYFVSEQLDAQIRYFDKAQRRHDNTASRFAAAGAMVAVVVAVAGYSGYSEYWLPFAALAGVIAPIFLTALSSWRDTGNDGEKAARYSEVWIALRLLKGQSIQVKAELETGDTAAVSAYIADVHKVLRIELETWTTSLQEQGTN